jgi:hypothetical protein
LDGLGIALISQDKNEDGMPVLLRAVAVAEGLKQHEWAARSRYNLACAYAKSGRFDEAHSELALCIEASADHYLGLARDDVDFEVAREREEFKQLLEL